MKDLATAEIGILDDQEKYLVEAEELFQSKGIKVKTMNNIAIAMKNSIENKSDIFISDLDLTKISNSENGVTVLNSIRAENDDIFLGLRTAYEYTLKPEERKALKANNVKIYSKIDESIFLDNLDFDYKQFQKERKEEKMYRDEFESEMMEMLFADTLSDLKGISNQEILVPVFIKAKNIYIDIKVSDLTKEVSNRSAKGMAFVRAWYQNIKFIDTVIKK